MRLTRRLATASRSQVCIYGSTVQKSSSNVVRSPCKIWLSFLILCARIVRGPKFEGGGLEPRPLWTWAWWPPETLYSPACVVISNFVALGQTVWAPVGGPQKIGESLGPTPWDGAWYIIPYKNTLLPLMCYRTKFSSL